MRGLILALIGSAFYIGALHSWRPLFEKEHYKKYVSYFMGEVESALSPSVEYHFFLYLKNRRDFLRACLIKKNQVCPSIFIPKDGAVHAYIWWKNEAVKHIIEQRLSFN